MSEQTSQPPAERVTHALVRDIDLAPFAATATGPLVLGLITLDNGEDHTKPNTLGPAGLAELRSAVEGLVERAHAGEIHAIGITGKPFHFAAGADLKGAASIQTEQDALTIAQQGHAAYRTLLDAPVPTFAFVSGVALGGGMELALACSYRTVISSVRNLGLPEVALGLIPGWGGTFLAPGVIGIEKALEVIIANPLRNNKQLTGPAAAELGLMDVVMEPADFLAESLRWAASVLTGAVEISRPEPLPAAHWTAVVEGARAMVDARLHGAAPAAYEALDLLTLSAQRDREASFAAEDAALARLLVSPEFKASMHAFTLTTSRAKRPVGAPSADQARPVRSVGIAGAGLMASQLALLLARRMKVPVIMRDLDDARVERGLGFVAAEVAKLTKQGRIGDDEANRITSLVSGTVDLADLAHADLVIEAVFEELDVKKQVFAELEQVISPATILATNTSALSVTAMAADLQHPERVVGLHFFNPVAQMPLVEVVRAERTDDAAYATAFAVAKASGKSAIAVADRPGFVVNRLLVRLLGEVLGSLEDGTDVATADAALRPLGLPMGPFQLLQLVGPAVAKHVLDTLRENLGERYPTSPGLDRMVEDGAPFVTFEGRPDATSPVDPAIASYFGSRAGHGESADELLARVRQALAEEVRLMMAEGVVTDTADIDLGMILGAGWPFHLGGITPYLQRTGAL
ncbi:3-hydroxyacyl-CoA dehydrogenase NAD-binding domain-containing protein [Pseudactinotalea suaedae]|uniref:3-hydroxyacyl-CoA dehydrogenase NAD-binding domain-containing protein n=1 Tax=Pseudactinotalea suaedae TaxID=1524924 RepID=UPI0012E16603|nr:3-hydroxyacyl-CoA dehydrogenase NAD-binding domain-containing protein [Pseudactinotalea suaedae]